MITLQATGFKELHAQLEELGAEMGAKVLRVAARKAFLPVYDAAHRYGLRSMDTGALLDAIKLQVIRPKSGDEIVVVGIKISGKMARSVERSRGLKHRNPSRRWHFVEFGTVKMAAKPFLRPAIEGNAALVVSILKDELVKGIKRAVRKKAKG